MNMNFNWDLDDIKLSVGYDGNNLSATVKCDSVEGLKLPAAIMGPNSNPLGALFNPFNGIQNAITAAPSEKGNLCKICRNAKCNTAFIPCGHAVACGKCASLVNKCPECKEPFRDLLDLHF